MKKLSKTHQKDWKEALGALQIAGAEVEEAREAMERAVEGAVRAHLGKLIEAVEEARTALDALGMVRDSVVEEMQTYQDGRTEAWFEGASGQAFGEWQSEWECLETESCGEDALEIIFQAVRERLDEEAPELPAHEDSLYAAGGITTELSPDLVSL